MIDDPLRRFVDTPYRTRLIEAGFIILVETNAEWLTSALCERLRQGSNLDLYSAITNVRIVLEDADAGRSDDVTLVESSGLRTVLIGTQTMLCHDAQSSELFGFLAGGDYATHHIDLALDALFAGADSGPLLITNV